MLESNMAYGLRYLLLKLDPDSITDGVARAFAGSLLHVRVHHETLVLETTEGEVFELKVCKVGTEGAGS